MHHHPELTTIANREDVLNKLRENREKHATIVIEARQGYVDAAMKALEKRLGRLREGKITDLVFQLRPPVDHTDDYDTAIRMMEWHKAETIELTATDFRCYIEDNWGWKRQFLASNALYSKTAEDMLDE